MRTIAISLPFAASRSGPRRIGLDLILLGAVILLANLALFTGRGSPVATYGFLTSRVAAGEWWRVAAHPLAHVSLYHLALDAGAFLMLYHGLNALSAGRRLLLCFSAASGSLALGALAPVFAHSGLCGLSGAAHGLMAASALLSLRSRAPAARQAGWILLAAVGLKSLLEALSGQVFFVSLHLGNVGQPNPYCHLGGVLGGLAAVAFPSFVEDSGAVSAVPSSCSGSVHQAAGGDACGEVADLGLQKSDKIRVEVVGGRWAMARAARVWGFARANCFWRL